MGWRTRREAKKAAGGGDTPDVLGDPYQTSDVRIIKVDAAAADETGQLDEPDGALLAELSEAFADTDILTDNEIPTDTEPEADAGVESDVESDLEAVDASLADRATIAIGGDDEMGDIAYLDEMVAGDDDSGTVFIDDEGRSDAMQASAAGVSTVDARMRQRRIGVRRARSRRRLWWVVGISAAFIVVVGALAALGSGWFAVKDVTVLGQVYADQVAVDEVVADLEGTPVVLVDATELEERLEQIPWVESARITTDFPDAATIELREREPVATVQGTDARFRVLDRDGRVLDVIDGQAAAVVLITGPDPVDLLAGQFTDVGHAAAAALVTKLTPDVRARIVAIQTTADGAEMALVLRSADGEGPDIVVRLGSAIGDNDQIEKLVRLERVLDDADGAGATQIDVSTAETTQR